MRIVLRDVDPSSFNLEFYDDADRYDERRYLGTLKLNRRDWQHLRLIQELRQGEIVAQLPIKFEAIRYLLTDKL